MNKKQETDLKIISGIDGEIIDKNSQKRYELLTKKKIKKWIIPSSVAAVIVLAIMVPILILLFAKQVPVYEGMTVSNYKPSSSAENVVDEREPHRFSFLSNTNGNNGNNGNHYGQNKKPVDEIIEEDTSIGIEIPEQPMYYAKAGQEIYITVHISNPDSFEILSFTLNGKKYSSYMFEEGSDMENLILKVTVPADAEGVIDYTIDAIKYVDGTDIKDVDMRGEKTVKVGVYTSKQPKATVSEELVRINDVSFDVSLSDTLGLIERCGGKAFAVVVDGESVVAYKEITVGEEHITFEGLETYTSYRYGVVAYYDALDGKGMDVKILFEKEFTTQSVVAPDNIVKTQTSIEFGLIFNELYEDKNVTSISFYHGADKVKDFDVSGDALAKTFSATELLSNNEYTIVISYINVGATETVEFKVTTEAKATPDFEITEIEKTQTSFKFDIAITDVDAVGVITKLELIHGEDVTNVEDLTARELTNLLSNNDYTLKVTYTYDLNDGVGEQTLVKEFAVKTEEKVEPTFTLKDVTSDSYTVSGSYEQTNVDNTLISYVVELYRDGELVKENTDKEIAFDSLDYYTDYTVKITYTFDVNDGKGVQEKTVEQKIKTLPYIDVESVIVRNTTSVSAGEVIYLQLDIVNPCNATVTNVVINGNRYLVSNSSSAERVFVEFTCDEELGGGEITLTVEEISIDIDKTSYICTPISQKSDTVFINGILELVSVEFVNEQNEPIYWYFDGEKLLVKFTFNNPTNYEIREIVISGESDRYHGSAFEDTITNESIVRINENEYIVELFDTDYDRKITRINVSYGNQYMSKSLQADGTFAHCEYIASSEKIYISNAQEFLKIQLDDGYQKYYELTADIDLSGIQWNPCTFYGVLNGNGYSIKNWSILGAGHSERFNSLFSSLSGVVYDLKFENAFVMVNRTEGTSVGIIATDNLGSIINCSIDSTSVINAGGGDSYAGAIAMRNLGGIIKNCINNASVAGFSAGGIVVMNEGFISHCINNGEIMANSVGGGISAYNSSSIYDCVNEGAINGSGLLDGISAENNGIIERCTNNGEIIYTN